MQLGVDWLLTQVLVLESNINPAEHSTHWVGLFWHVLQESSQAAHKLPLEAKVPEGQIVKHSPKNENRFVAHFVH